MRRSRLILLLLLPVALLAGCSGSSHASSSSSSTTASSSLDGVTVTGSAGQVPTLKLAKTPFSVTNTVTKVLTPGSGPTIVKGQRVRVDYLLVNGRTDKAADSTYGKTSVVFTADPSQLLPGLADGLINQKVGSRMLLAVPPKDAFGTTGNTQLGVQKDDTLVFVLDLKSATTPIAKPTGHDRAAQEGPADRQGRRQGRAVDHHAAERRADEAGRPGPDRRQGRGRQGRPDDLGQLRRSDLARRQGLRQLVRPRDPVGHRHR